MTNPSLRGLCLPLAVLAALSLPACAASSKAAVSAPAAASSPAAAASTPKPTPRPSPTMLTKAQFVTKMEAVCADVSTRVKRLPQNPQNIADVAKQLQGLLVLYPPYLAQADALVNRSADKATLTRNWLSLEKSDFAAVKPVFTKFLADVKAGNGAGIVADAEAMENISGHSEAIARFLSGYGMKSCAKLQSS